MSITSSREKVPDGLRTHLDGLADSVSYYYGRLLAVEVPEDLAKLLTVEWQKGKVQAWVEQQRLPTHRPSSPPPTDRRSGAPRIG